MQQANILGISRYLPQKILTNDDMEKLVDTSDEWIRSRSGIVERRICSEEEYASCMGVKASKKLLEKVGVDAAEIDYIIVSTMTPDYLSCPSTACLIQRELRATNAATCDIQATCSGFIYGLNIAKGFIVSKMYKNILVISTEKMSSIVNYKDRKTCVLFGDGAGVALVSNRNSDKNCDETFSVGNIYVGSDGNFSDFLIVPNGGSRMPAKNCDDKDGFTLHMEGKSTYKKAVTYMEDAVRKCLASAQMDITDINWIVPHQANSRIIQGLIKRLKFPEERAICVIDKYGNTSSSAVVIALKELVDRKVVNREENVLLVTFGGGITWGSALLTKN